MQTLATCTSCCNTQKRPVLQSNVCTCFMRFILSPSIFRLIVLSRDSAVSRTDSPHFDFRRKKDRRAQTVPEVQAVNKFMFKVVLSPGVKWPGCEAGKSPTSSAHVMIGHSYRLPPRLPQYALMECTGNILLPLHLANWFIMDRHCVLSEVCPECVGVNMDGAS